MKISKEDVIRINKGFGGNLRSDSSLDFAFKMQENKKLGDYKKLAYLWRAILVDHPFSDGNKRSGAFLFVDFLNRNGRLLDDAGQPVINDIGLAALALLVAESDPVQKETMISLIMNMLASGG